MFGQLGSSDWSNWVTPPVMVEMSGLLEPYCVCLHRRKALSYQLGMWFWRDTVNKHSLQSFSHCGKLKYKMDATFSGKWSIGSYNVTYPTIWPHFLIPRNVDFWGMQLNLNFHVCSYIYHIYSFNPLITQSGRIQILIQTDSLRDSTLNMFLKYRVFRKEWVIT